MFDLSMEEIIILAVIVYATYTMVRDVLHLAIILIGVYIIFFRKKKETFKDTKECSQEAINKGRMEYTFSTPKFVR
jgi:uncharacterized membrane protein